MMFTRRPLRPRYSKPAGRPGVGSGLFFALLLSAVLTSAAIAATESYTVGAPAAGSSGAAPTGFSVDQTLIAVEMDDAVTDTVRLQKALAEQGFFKPELLLHASGVKRKIFSVKVDKADAATLAWLASVPGVRTVHRTYRVPGVDSVLVSTGELVLRPKPGVTEDQVRALAAQQNCSVVRKMGIGITMYVLRVNDEITRGPVEAAASLNGSGLARFAQSDFYVKKTLTQIDDPLVPNQWHLQNRGQTGGTPGADVKAVDAWNTTLGEGAIVAVLDDGIDWQHPDLVDNVIARYDFDNDDDDPSPYWPGGWVCVENCDDPDMVNSVWCDICNLFPYMSSCQNRHGTATAGLVAARANEIGVRGVAPMASLVAEAMLSTSFIGVADAFYFAEANGAQVASNSWGYTPLVPLDVIRTAIEDISVNGRGGRGVLVMFSSGNDATTIRRSQNLDVIDAGVMFVGATLKDDRLTCYSSYGSEQSVVAPGGGMASGLVATLQQCYTADITTTDVSSVPVTPISFFLIPIWAWCPNYPDALLGYNPPDPASIPMPPVTDYADTNYHNGFSGTSAACPVAAGCAALVFSIDPTLTALQVRGILEHTADKVQTYGAGYDVVTGHNDMYGHGRVNAARAVQAAVEGKVWPSHVTGIENGSVADQVYFYWANPREDVETILIVRSVGPLNFAPVDGRSYAVGEQVAPNTIVVANDLITSYTDNAAPSGDLNYALFVKNANSFYSWGRRVLHESQSVPNSPLATVTASPSAGPAPLTVLFSGGAIDPQNRPIISYAWDFGDGTTGGGASVQHTYNAAGQYLARLTVTNSVGLPATATVLVSVQPAGSGPAPTFSVTLTASPRGGSPPLTVSFGTTISPSSTLVDGYVWDFGDNTGTVNTAVGSTSHTYLAAGSYTAKVQVTDFLGATFTASTSIVVSGGGSQATRETTDESASMPPLCGAGAVPMMAVTMLMLASLRLVGRRSRRSFP